MEDIICNDSFLIKKYDPLRLMVCHSVMEEIEKEAEKEVTKFINYTDEIKNIHLHVWVNPILFEVFCYLRSIGKTKNLFKYNIDFNLNKKMNDNEYKIFNIVIKIADNCTSGSDV
jgi:hypothetical protein